MLYRTNVVSSIIDLREQYSTSIGSEFLPLTPGSICRRQEGGPLSTFETDITPLLFPSVDLQSLRFDHDGCTIPLLFFFVLKALRR